MTVLLPSGTVTFLYTDIEGSATLWEREPKPMQAALDRHHAILHHAVAGCGGHVYKIIGDAFQAAFEVAGHAVQAAVAAQRALSAEAWPTSVPLRVRMGLHAGYAVARGSDYTTTHTLNRVARIMAAAHGGQILLSEAVEELSRDELPAGAGLRDLGLHYLKGLTRPERLLQVEAPDLPLSFPPPNTVDAPVHNLPSQLTAFIGRETEVAEVKRLLAGARLVTLTGSGGCGKTRLSIQVAHDVLADFAQGVWLVELAPLSDPALIPSTLAAVLGLLDDGRRPMLELLVGFLRYKSLLVVLDNCEHVIEGCAQLSASVLRACPTVRILASSREALGVAGEVAYRVPSLAVPHLGQLPTLEQLASLDAVRLFVERAAAARPGFALTTQNAAAIVQICQRLDGIPLAIELAAARVRLLAPAQIAARLDDRFQLLTGGSRTALPRQQTLRALIDWSYSLLSEPEQRLFRRLAVFLSGWTLEAAEVVCAGNGLEAAAVLDTLSRLVDKSLVLADETADETRYRRLETIRQYSREKFAVTDEVEALRDRHLAYYVQFCELAEVQLQGRESPRWTRRLEAEHDNIRAALQWGLARHPASALRIAGALQLFWNSSGYSAEGLRWTQQALEQGEAPTPEDLAVKAKALCGLAFSYLSRGDNERAQHLAEESVALYRQDTRAPGPGLASALEVLAQAHFFLGRGAEAEALLQESLTVARAASDVSGAVTALVNLARVRAVMYGDLDRAQAYSEEGLRLARNAGMHWLTSVLSQNLGLIAGQRGEVVEARRRFAEAIAAFQDSRSHFNVILAKSELAHLELQIGNQARALELYRETIVAFRDMSQHGAVAHQLECFAFIALAQAQYERAVRLLGAAEAWRERAGTLMTPQEQAEYQQRLVAARSQFSADLFAGTWAAGRMLTIEEAIHYAITAEFDPPG
jgi:predicted ATPase/class 3 adenylate cyclase